MAPTREKIIRHQTPLALPPMRHLCISEVLISWQQQNYNSTIYLRLNKTHIHPTIQPFHQAPSKLSTLGNSNHKKVPAGYNQLGRPICNSTLWFPRISRDPFRLPSREPSFLAEFSQLIELISIELLVAIKIWRIFWGLGCCWLARIRLLQNI